MKTLILSGSKNRSGKTAAAIEAIHRGIVKAKGEAEILFLTELTIEKCRPCNKDGWGICRTEHRCIIEDDFAVVAEKTKTSDAVVFATPVYFHDISESMRGFLDRLRRTRFMFGPPAGPGMLPQQAATTPAVGICYAGGSGNGAISCAFFLERILQGCGFDVIDMIPVRRQNIDMKIPHLERVGEWLTTKPVSGPPLMTPPPPVK
jgi:multimeric flavodoxin WrbA